ncbi:MAG: hypothetical protein K1X68_09400 [Saprospiraceae bacterium]|nr:hypothetical protein [Saprospiraceae bacterium]HMW38037.1 hypothetical protein [Saprospiraceae bacterium]HMX86999.1 hypothetical protein [Saprospiraceae bacterium]HMZ39822.1 hypothetical protein [Saprospiraceae bacterium]HNB30182.1 hypothetical protein [Saprospiraceae bacterium]
MNTNDKTYLYYLKVTILPMVVFVLLGIVVWQCNTSALKDRQQKEVSQIIHNVLHEQSKREMMLPQMVFLNTDSSNQKELNEKLIEQITTILTQKYLSNDTTKFSDIELKPFYVLPSKPNKNGSYTLTENQLNELKGHLDFLTKQVDVEVDKAKEEIGRDIDRLNLWVTIWIGVIGFLGIIIPIIINIDTAKSAEKATDKSDLAFSKADAAITKITNAQPKIDKIDGIEGRITTAEGKIGGIEDKAIAAEGKANEADKKANAAKSKSDALHLVYAIDKLSSIEPENIKYVDRDKWIPLFKKTLLTIKHSLDECKMQHDGDIVRESLTKMVIRLTRISFQKFLQNDNTENITKYLQFVTETMKSNYNQENFEKIITRLETLANNLKNE